MNYSNVDICEVIAKQEGYELSMTVNKNISEWYGFEDKNGNIARFKVCKTTDKSGNYNFYKKNLDCKEKNLKAIYIIVFNSPHLCYRKIECDHFSNTNDPRIVISKQNLACTSWTSLILDETIIEVISQTNSHYNRILDRSQNVDKVAIVELVLQQNKRCYYCGIKQEQIDTLKTYALGNKHRLPWCFDYGLTKREYRNTLEIDQKNPTEGYVVGNIVWACSWCNNAKTDTFTDEEFKVIGKSINCIWNRRFKEIDSDEKVIYPLDNEVEDCSQKKN